MPYADEVKTRVRLDIKKLQAVAGKTPEIENEVAKALGTAILDQAIENIRTVKAVDTGALLNSGYLETSTESGRAEALAAAQKLRTSAKSSAGESDGGDALEEPEPLSEGMARVSFAVEHAAYVELGTAVEGKTRMAARPFLIPAAEVIRDEAEDIAAAVVKDVLGL
jgi:hypothetical protein